MGPTAASCLYPGQLHSWRCSSEGHGQQETSQVFPGLFLCQGSALFPCPAHPIYHQKQTWHPGFLVQETMSLLMEEAYKRHGEPAEALQTLHTGYSVGQSWCPPWERQVVSVTEDCRQRLMVAVAMSETQQLLPSHLFPFACRDCRFSRAWHIFYLLCRQHCNAYQDLWSICQQSSKGRLFLTPNLPQ